VRGERCAPRGWVSSFVQSRPVATGSVRGSAARKPVPVAETARRGTERGQAGLGPPRSAAAPFYTAARPGRPGSGGLASGGPGGPCWVTEARPPAFRPPAPDAARDAALAEVHNAEALALAVLRGRWEGVCWLAEALTECGQIAGDQAEWLLGDS
jgi:hypothetical protein